MSNKLRSIQLLRLANECMVGQYPDRVVPTFVFHQFAAPLFVPDTKLVHLISTLGFNPAWSLANGLDRKVPPAIQDQNALMVTMQGLLNPDRRMFLAKQTQTATVGSSNTFPLIASLITRGGADEGLGRRCFAILNHYHPECFEELIRLLAPVDPSDPVTAIVMTLTGDQNSFVNHEWQNSIPNSEKTFTKFDENCADFLRNLIANVQHAGRIYAIRDIEIGLQFVGLLQMTSGFIARFSESIPKVFVYGGMPPGPPNDMQVRFATSSYSEWISTLWRAIGDRLLKVLNDHSSLPNETSSKAFLQKVNIAMTQAKVRDKELQMILEAISVFLESRIEDWTIFDLMEETLAFPPSELARRVRSLGQSIGFTAPDRGEGAVRLVLDTPLLNVLIRGLLGSSSMNFEDFVSMVSKKFGLVLGPGSDDSVMSELNGQANAGLYELLLLNQDALQERLLRAGFARAYSDSHTEVLSYSLNKR